MSNEVALNIFGSGINDVSINVDLSDMPETNSASTMLIPTISKTEKCIAKIYDETVKSELKRLELQHRFPSKKIEHE